MVSITPEDDNDDRHDTYATMIGGSVMVRIPPDALDHAKLEVLKEDDNTDKVPFKLEEEDGKHGPYYSMWNVFQQSE